MNVCVEYFSMDDIRLVISRGRLGVLSPYCCLLYQAIRVAIHWSYRICRLPIDTPATRDAITYGQLVIV